MSYGTGTQAEAQALYRTLATDLGPAKMGFPNISTIAEFRPHSQTIHLHNIGRENFHRLVKAGEPAALRTHLETMLHEVTHWADMIGTLWGREHLVRTYNAIFAAGLQSAGTESGYWMMIDLHDADRRIGYPDYYKMIAEGATGSPRDPWAIEYTSGIEFDENGYADPTNPILFVKFSDRRSGSLVARQPLSVSAMLETNARWSELATGLEILRTMGKDEQLVEQKLWGTSLLEAIYHPELTEYSGPAHMLSVLAGTREIFSTYHAASIMSFVALNVPNRLFESIIHPNNFDIYGAERLSAFRRRKNRAFIFAVLCHFADPYPDNLADVPAWIDSALARAGLPKTSDVLQAAQAEMPSAKNVLIESEYSDTARYLLDVGEELFAKRIQWKEPALTMGRIVQDKVTMPLMFDENAELFALSDNALNQARYDPLKLFGAEWMLRKRTENFLSACR